MLQIVPSGLDLNHIYAEAKFWSIVIGAFFSLHKGLKWLEGLKTALSAIDKKLTAQTDSIVKELGELRNDIRAVTVSRPVRARSAKRKKEVDNLPAQM